MRSIPFLLCIVMAAACSKKDDKPSEPATTPTTPTTPTPSADKPPEPAAKSAEPAAADSDVPAPAVQKLGCDKVLPQALRDKYFAGGTVTDVDDADASGHCGVKLKEGPTYHVSAFCWATPERTKDGLSAMESRIGMMKEKTMMEGVGRKALHRFIGTNREVIHIEAFDADSDCELKASVPASVDPKAFTTDALATFPTT